MVRKIRRSAALAGVVVLGLTGCGDTTGPDGAQSSTSPETGPMAPTDGTQDRTGAATQTRSTDETTEDDMRSPTPVPRPTGESSLPTGPVPEAVLQRPHVQEAISDYAKRMDVDVDQVEIVGFAEVTWSDGSLGCPQPGMMYTQALVPGYQLVLRVDGRLGSYHAAKDKPFDYCARPTAPARGGPTDR